MKFKVLIAFMIIQQVFTTYAQNPSTVKLYGRVKSDRDSIALVVRLYSSYFPTVQGIHYTRYEIPITKNGDFNISITTDFTRGRMILFDKVTNSVLFSADHQLVEGNDSILINGSIHDKSEPYYFKASFKGKGSSKYNCVQAINKIGIPDSLYKEKNIHHLAILYDSIVHKKQSILNKFKNELPDLVYKIMAADIVGEIKYDLLNFSVLLNDHSKFDTSSVINLLINLSKNTENIPDNITAQSPFYISFLYSLEKCKLTLSKLSEFKNLYSKLRDSYRGALQENLLYFCILDSWQYDSINPDDFSYCVIDAINYITNPELKKSVEIFKQTRIKGVTAFNFTLPVDSSNYKISLSDYRGKVILLDLWGYQCTGCYLFANIFHEKIYPIFKDRTDFAVISIMTIGETTKKLYMDRLRGVGGVHYTFPEYINLFGGKGEDMGRQIENHYKILAAPFIMLLDKQGKIYSTTIPFFTDPNSPNIDKLTSLINEALNQK